MTKKTALATLATVVVAVSAALWKWGDHIEFVLGGALVNAGYHLQDRVHDYDLAHHEVTPQQVWDELMNQNHLASAVLERWPRLNHHAVVAIVACMDARLDTNEIVGDTRHYYYVLRLAGSTLSPKEEEMLELAVDGGTKVVLFTTHSDCAAEKAAADPVRSKHFPNLTQALSERKMRYNEFLQREHIKKRIDTGELLVKWMHLDTATESLTPVNLSAMSR